MTFEEANKNGHIEVVWHVCICDTCRHRRRCYLPNHVGLQDFGNAIKECEFYDDERAPKQFFGTV